GDLPPKSIRRRLPRVARSPADEEVSSDSPENPSYRRTLIGLIRAYVWVVSEEIAARRQIENGTAWPRKCRKAEQVTAVTETVRWKSTSVCCLWLTAARITCTRWRRISPISVAAGAHLPTKSRS